MYNMQMRKNKNRYIPLERELLAYRAAQRSIQREKERERKRITPSVGEQLEDLIIDMSVKTACPWEVEWRTDVPEIGECAVIFCKHLASPLQHVWGRDMVYASNLGMMHALKVNQWEEQGWS